MQRLLMPATQLTALRDHLLQADGQERFAYVFCTRSGDDRLLVADMVLVPDEAMDRQSRTGCRPELAYEREQLQTCLENGYQPLLVHSHPFSNQAGFSGTDIEAIDRYTDWLHPLYPDALLAFGVFGRREFEATVYDPATERFRELPTRILGGWTLDHAITVDDWQEPVDTTLYDRSIRLLTETGQRRLAATTVAVVGTGGLGFILAKQLVRLGVQKLVLIDPDMIERSNLNRLLGVSMWDVGRPKVTVLAEHLHDTGLDLEVEVVQARVEDATEVLRQCDIVIGTADRVTARSFLNQFCVTHLRYYIDAGTVIRTENDQVTAIEGIVQLVVPGVTGCYACLDRADPERARREQLSTAEREEELAEGYIEASDLAPEPAVVTLNGTIASQTAAVVARVAAGYAVPPAMLRYNEIGYELQELTTRPDPKCPICGEYGILGQGDRPVSADDLTTVDPALDLELGDGWQSHAEEDGSWDRAAKQVIAWLHRTRPDLLPEVLRPERNTDREGDQR